MKPESLDALGAIAVGSAGGALAAYRERLPEIIGDAARVIADNPLQFAFLLSADYVVGRVVLNLVKPQGLGGIVACGIVSYAACTLVAAELFKRDLIKIKLREEKS